MNIRKLILLVIILAILIVIAFFTARREEPARLSEEVGLTKLFPEHFIVGDIIKAEIYLKDGQAKKVILEKIGERWRVKSHFNAPADEKKLGGFLRKIRTLEGEFRSKDPSILQDYNLKDNALHLVFYKEGSPRPLFHLLAGKRIGSGGFVRTAEDSTVYEVNTNLWADVGIWGNEAIKAPSSYWIDKVVIDLDKESIQRLAIRWPHREAVFEKKEKVKEKEEEGRPKNDKQKDYKWSITKGPAGKALKLKGVEAIVGALDRFSASSVIDPRLKREKGLENPAFKCEITMKDGEKHVILGALPEPGHEGFMTLSEGDGTLYQVSSSAFMRIFKPGRDLFELKPFKIDPQKIRALILRRPEEKLELIKEGENYKVMKGPPPDRVLNQTKAKRIWDALARLQPIDFIEEKEKKGSYGLEEPEYKATIRLDSGKIHTLAFGNSSKTVEGRYMSIDEDPEILVIGRYDFNKIFPPLKELFDVIQSPKKDIKTDKE